MIVTVTPNPSLDRTLEVGHLVRGEVLRAAATSVEPGGKGINVARALHAHGHAVVAVLPSGGFEGEQLVALLAGEGFEPVVIKVREAVRANVSLVEPDGTVTKINEPGPALSADEVGDLLGAVGIAASGAAWVVGSGSLPPAAPTTLFAELVEHARRAGARVAIDTSGPALDAALAARPDLVKPNAEELAQAAGTTIRTLADAVEAAKRLRAAGAATVLASLGAAGALLVDAEGVLYAQRPVAAPRSSVGAGDATLAGYLTMADGDRAKALATAVAFGAAAVALPGSRMPGPSDVLPELVVVTDQPNLALSLAPDPGPEPGARATANASGPAAGAADLGLDAVDASGQRTA